MSTLIIISCLCLLPWSVISVHPSDLSDHETNFKYFKETFGKLYESEFEHAKRFEIFKKNMEEAMESNKRNGRENYGITKFSDLTYEEFSQIFGTISEFSNASCDIADLPGDEYPPSYDWRALGMVSPVRNQLYCGSCWAFSVIGAVESQVLIKQNKNLSLSEQQLVDCDLGSNGCSNGVPHSAMEYLISYGSVLAEDYPYRAVDQQCQFNSKKAAVNVSNCFTYNDVSEEELAGVLYQTGPLSIAVFASEHWSNYRSGIMNDCVADKPPNHAVLLVGYGTENGEDYWLIKNSWGIQGWGEEGYIKLQRGSNQCALLEHPPLAVTLA